MKSFRGFLIVAIICLAAYTLVVGANHGWNILPIFLADIISMTWPGQFNLDFMIFLALSGIWLAWRHHFSVGGVVLGVIGFFGGTMVLAPYLLYVSFQANGDIKEMFLGKKRATAMTEIA